MDRALPARELGLAVGLRKGHPGLTRLVDEGSGQHREKLGQQHALFQLRLHRLARLRFDPLPVHLDLDVDDRQVAQPELALHRRDLGHRLAHLFETAFEHLRGDLVAVKVGLKSRDVRERHLGHHADRRLQLCGTAALELEDLHVGVVDRVDRLLHHGLAHHLGDHRLNDLFTDHGRPQAGLDQGARRMAGPESFDLRP